MLDIVTKYVPLVISRIGVAFLYIMCGWILEKIGKKIIRKIVRTVKHLPNKDAQLEARIKTIVKLLGEVYSAFLYSFVILQILKAWGIDITPLLAGAGIVGLAIGFGSKEIVKDLVYGFFIIFDGQYNVGDYIEAAGFKGKVKTIGIRTTILKGPDGATYIIPNGQVTKVAVYKKKPQWWGTSTDK